MRNVIALYCDENNVSHILECIKSLIDGIKCPDEIVVTVKEGVKTPPSLKKKDRVYVNRIDQDYGELSAIVGLLDRYPEHDNVNIVYADSRCAYPVHILDVFDESMDQLEAGIKSQKPDTDGFVFGCAGITMVEDKKRNLDRELEALTSDNDVKYELKTLLGYPNQNLTVDFLESRGFVVFRRALIKDKEFLSYLQKVYDPSRSSDILLSNYFSQQKFLKASIYNHIVNRPLLEKMRCFINIKEDQREKMDLYEKTIIDLRNLECFHVYE
jgi:hypothetical protein